MIQFRIKIRRSRDVQVISFQIRADDRRDRNVVIFRDQVHISFLQPCLCFLSVHNIPLPSNTLPIVLLYHPHAAASIVFYVLDFITALEYHEGNGMNN